MPRCSITKFGLLSPQQGQAAHPATTEFRRAITLSERSPVFWMIWILVTAGAAFLTDSPRASGITYDVEFSDYRSGPDLKWLAMKGFEPQRDAANENRVVFSHTGHALVLETKKRAAGLIVSEVRVPTYTKIRIKWGVNVFPAGASYAKGIRSESIMVYVFFGTEKISSGHFLVPDSPYFIGLFLSDSDPVGEGFQGRYFKAGGRYICVDRAPKDEEITTDFPIADAFKQMFGQSHAPAISGIGIGIDTENAKGNGVAKAFIREIELIQ